MSEDQKPPRNLKELVDKERQRLEDSAKENMLRPKADPFEHGLQVGQWQGVDDFLNRIDEMVRKQKE